MPQYRYCMWTADKAGVREHPQRVILRFAPDATNLEGVAIADCWMFDAREIADPPPYIIDVVKQQAEMAQVCVCGQRRDRHYRGGQGCESFEVAR